MAGPPRPLTVKQQLFVEEYLVDGNATGAARRAGYSEKSAESIGAENTRKPQIAAAIDAAQLARSEKTKVTQERVIEELAAIAFGDAKDMFDADGNLLNIHDMSPATRARIGTVKVSQRRMVTTDSVQVESHLAEIKVVPKETALNLLGRNLGMWRDKMEVSGEVSLLDALRRIEAQEDADKEKTNG